MPCIKIIDSIKIYIHRRDHHPPHFHVSYNQMSVPIEINSLKILAGKLPKNVTKKVIKWAKKNKPFLSNEWSNHNP